FVSRIRSEYARTECRKVTARRPLLPILRDSPRAAAEQRLHRQTTLLQRGEQISLFLHVAVAFAPMKYRQTIRSNEVGRINNAQIAIDLGKDHVEMDCRCFLRHHDDDEVGHVGLLEDELGESIDTGWARALAEANQQHILAQRVHVPTLESVVAAPLG